MMVFISYRKLHVSAYSDHSGFDNFLAIKVTYNTHKSRGDVEISTSLSIACFC